MGPSLASDITLLWHTSSELMLDNTPKWLQSMNLCMHCARCRLVLRFMHPKTCVIHNNWVLGDIRKILGIKLSHANFAVKNWWISSQHWYRFWTGAVRQQAITWTITRTDWDLRRHAASLGGTKRPYQNILSNISSTFCTRHILSVNQDVNC